ncbi:hypothetical protein [Moheibacter sp.]|uniref:hypothetical protein n=1 Tax=Moheibacter sp. TaxID=1965316 RepID=UPI003C770112
MKKLGLLIVGAFLFAACDSTPKGNKGVYPVTYDEIAEDVDHSEHHVQKADTAETEVSETADSAQLNPAPTTAQEPTDSAQ